MIDNSEMLQYIIDFRYFRMLEVGTSEMDVQLPARRKRLRVKVHVPLAIAN